MPPPATTTVPTWTITHDSTEDSAETWGISNMRGHFMSQAVDVVTFDGGEVLFDSAPLFAYNDTITIRSNRVYDKETNTWSGGQIWFVGVVTKTTRTGTANGERISYTVEGPWRYFEKRLFEQLYYNALLNGVPYNLGIAHVWLGTKGVYDTGHWGIYPASTGEQIGFIADWILDADHDGAVFSKGAILTRGGDDVSITAPWDEVRDATCSDCVRKMLRWNPEAVTWFDYNQTPPVFHVDLVPEMTAVTFDIGTRPLSSVNIEKRDDLLVPIVVLKYEKLNEVDGHPSTTMEVDYYPTSGVTKGEFASGAFKATMDLKGITATHLSAQVGVNIVNGVDLGPIPIPTNDALFGAWIIAHLGYQGDRNTITYVANSSSGRATGFSAYPNELTQGQLAAWMRLSTPIRIPPLQSGTPITYRQEIIKAVVEETSIDAATGAATKSKKTVTLNMVTTNAISGTYQTLETVDPADTTPVGLAEYFYLSLNKLTHSGQIELSEEEVNTAFRAAGITDRTGVGLKINLTGGRAEWSTMNMMVQESTVDVDSGKTTLVFGPPAHLGLDDLIELLQVTRRRGTWHNPLVRGDTVSPNSSAQLGKYVSELNTDSGGPTVEHLKIATQTGKYVETGYRGTGHETDDIEPIGGASRHRVVGVASSPATIFSEVIATAAAVRHRITDGVSLIDLNTADVVPAITGTLTDKTLKVREYAVCENGVEKKVLLIGSETY